MKFRKIDPQRLGLAALVFGLTMAGPALADAGHGPSGIWANLVHPLGGNYHIIDLAGIMFGAATLILVARSLKQKSGQPARRRTRS